MWYTTLCSEREGATLFHQFEFGKNGLRRVLGPLELSVMEAVWAASGPVTIRDVCDTLAHAPSAPAFTTVMTVMNRLVGKGLLDRTGNRKNYQFRATVSKGGLETKVSQSVIKEILSDYGPMAINHFVEAVHADPDKMSLLENLLEKKEEGPGEGEPS